MEYATTTDKIGIIDIDKRGDWEYWELNRARNVRAPLRGGVRFTRIGLMSRLVGEVSIKAVCPNRRRLRGAYWTNNGNIRAWWVFRGCCRNRILEPNEIHTFRMLHINVIPSRLATSFLQVNCTHWRGSQTKAAVFLWVGSNGWVVKDVCGHMCSMMRWAFVRSSEVRCAKWTLFANGITFTRISTLDQKARLSWTCKESIECAWQLG